MRIDPVYLVAPPPQSFTPTRRALLFAGASFVVGTGLGGACGYAMGAKAGRADAPADASGDPAADEPLVSTGDADLDELRRLAIKAPIAELMENAPMFVDVQHLSYPKDRVLWQGLARICDALLAGHAVPNRRVFATVVAQQIENGDPTLAAELAHRVGELRRLK